MCRCCQSCYEDCYWYCIEERFCFDMSIAKYNADDDYYAKKKPKAFAEGISNDHPICEQPGRQDGAPISSKIRDEDYRQIQTNVPFLAPEILAVFANSQIFNDSQPNKSLAIVHKSPAIIDDKKNARDRDAEVEKKLLKRLEGTNLSIDDENPSISNASQSHSKLNELILRPPIIKTSMSVYEDDTDATNDTDDDDKIDKHNIDNTKLSFPIKTQFIDKRLRSVQSVPYFSFRPASENDIFTIADNQISMTPEIPSISYSILPKNYENTPTIEKYKETVSLHSIQTTNKERASEMDLSMPRYFGKADLIAQSADNLVKSGPKKMEKSKRLKMIRANLPPLSIHINKEKSKERNIE